MGLSMLAFVAFALTSGCTPDYDLPGKPNPANRPIPDDQVLNFTALYERNCAGCHGADGELGPAPPLNDPLFLALIPDEQLEQVIRDGRHGTPMPAFARASGGTLTDEQVKALAEGIKPQWQPKAPASSAEAAAEMPPYLSPMADGLKLAPPTEERGAELFARACAECHGAGGIGGDSSYSSGGAIADPAFLALISDQALRRIIITGRPDLGMPTYAETDGRLDDFTPLTSTEIDDLVALLATWRARGGLANSIEP